MPNVFHMIALLNYSLRWNITVTVLLSWHIMCVCVVVVFGGRGGRRGGAKDCITQATDLVFDSDSHSKKITDVLLNKN